VRPILNIPRSAYLTINFFQFSDVAQLLRTYQFWLDDLYPRAKFADGLAIIERLGHSKRMQVMRKAWIDESKPNASLEEEEAEHERLPATVNPGSQPTATAVMHANMSAAEASPRPNTGQPENDIISKRRTNGLGPSASSPGEEVRGAPDEDELDALFAEESMQSESRLGSSLEMTPSLGVHRPKPPPEQSYDDDEEAMMEMDAFW
jgi:replication fork protection complex subunit Csm3/Swi3